MLIAHLPSGYLWSKVVGRAANRRFLWPALAGSVLPDLDLFYFYLIDGRAHHHHVYWTHLPVFWLTVAGAVFLANRILRLTPDPAILAFFGAILIHMVLDSVTAPTYWLAPFSDASVQLFEIPARYGHWMISFVLHWTFLIELAITTVAAVLIFRNARRRSRA